MSIRKSTVWVIALLAMLVGLLISACDTTSEPTATPVVAPSSTAQVVEQPTAALEPSPTAATPESSTNKIDFQIYGNNNKANALKQVAEGFKKSRPGVEVNVVHVPQLDEHITQVLDGYELGTPPLADVFIISYGRLGQLASGRLIEPAEGLLAKSTTLKEDMFYSQALDAFRYKGKLMCMPNTISSLVVYYNKDLFTQAGVPFPKADWTWDDFLSTAQRLTKDTDGDGKTDIYGIGVDPTANRLAPFIWQNGGEIVDNPEMPTALTLKTGATRQAIDFFTELGFKHKLAPTKDEAANKDIETRFAEGTLAMIVQNRPVTITFRQIKDFQWDVAPLPRQKQSATILSSDAYCVTAASKHKELAWSFVEYAVGQDGQEIAARTGLTVPSLKSVAQSQAFLASTQPPASNQVFLDVIPYIRRLPMLPTWPQGWQRAETLFDEDTAEIFYAIEGADDALDVVEKNGKDFLAEPDPQE